MQLQEWIPNVGYGACDSTLAQFPFSFDEWGKEIGRQPRSTQVYICISTVYCGDEEALQTDMSCQGGKGGEGPTPAPQKGDAHKWIKQVTRYGKSFQRFPTLALLSEEEAGCQTLA